MHSLFPRFRRGFTFRAVAAGLMVVVLSSCTTWKTVQTSPARYIGARTPESVRLRLRDGSTCLLGRPTVAQDTLRGVEGGEYRHIPLSDVEAMEAPEADKVKTAAVITLVSLALVGTIYVAASSDRVQE